MRAVIQRVSRATVRVGEGAAVEVVGSIERGLVVLLGVGRDDQTRDADWLAEKTVTLRIFDDEQGRMNRSVVEIGGGVLVVSQFTLWGDCRKGRRPSYDRAAPAEQAQVLYRRFVDRVARNGVRTAEGRFQAMMQVELTNDGPVTLIVESGAAEL